MMKRIGLFFAFVFKLVCSVICLALTLALLVYFAAATGNSTSREQAGTMSYGVDDRFEQFVTNSLSDALDGVPSVKIKKVYRLSDSDLIAPVPNPEGFGSTRDPEELQALIDGASELLEGQDLLFTTDTPLYGDSTVNYYYDPTILAMTWKQMIDNTIYVISEIKIADASQFRRLLSDGEYLSGSRYLTSHMAASVNAVVASNGDYYAMRTFGMIVNNRQLLRAEGKWMDTCVIDGNGDMHFVERMELEKEEDMQRYVEENDIRFSVSFGPVLVEDGKLSTVKIEYPVGEAKIHNARAALCQMDSLHYLLVIASFEPPYEKGILLTEFAAALEGLGCKMAYNLDGGRSGTLVMNNTLQNFIYERPVSDIIYFATAIPSGE